MSCLCHFFKKRAPPLLTPSDMEYLDVPSELPESPPDFECMWLESGNMVGVTAILDPNLVQGNALSPIMSHPPKG